MMICLSDFSEDLSGSLINMKKSECMVSRLILFYVLYLLGSLKDLR